MASHRMRGCACLSVALLLVVGASFVLALGGPRLAVGAPLPAQITVPWPDVPLLLPMRGDVEIDGFLPNPTCVPPNDHCDEDLYAVDMNSSDTRIFPTAPGKVVFAGWNCDTNGAYCYGNVVAIDHGNGLYSVYTHLVDGSFPTVTGTDADFVNYTTVIGEMGETGCPGCGAHLHFAVRRNTPGLTDPGSVLFGGTPEYVWGIIPGLPDPPAEPISIPAAPPTEPPGGIWVSPTDDRQAPQGDVLTLSARAYPTGPSDPAVAYVNFTIAWPGHSGPWRLACPPIVSPVEGDRYECVTNLRELGVPTGELTVSFDVYDLAGNSRLAPNGTHQVSWYPPGGFVAAVEPGTVDEGTDEAPTDRSVVIVPAEADEPMASLPAEYLGTWEGTGVQVNPAAEWPMVVDLTGGGVGEVVGTISYPSLGCGGDFVLRSAGGGAVEVTEDITVGTDVCVDGLTRLALASDGTLIYEWTSPDGASRASATLVLTGN